MKTSYFVLCCALALIVSAGVRSVDAQGKTVPKPKITRAIAIGAKGTDWLEIHSDGSGTVGFGDGGSYQGYFKAGAFDVEQVTQDLKELPIDEQGTWRTHYYFGFESERKGPKQPGPKYHTQDRELIPLLFEQAIELSGKKRTYFPPRFGALKAPLSDSDDDS